jgi:hypothetical protein
MGRLIVSMQLSVDGFIEGPGSANARLRACLARSAFPHTSQSPVATCSQ